MRVFRITKSLNFGGIEKVFELHAKYFDKVDYELVFVALNNDGHSADVLRGLGYRVIILGEKNSRIPSFSTFKILFSLFKYEKPDVVHTCGAEANFHGLLAAFFAGVKHRVAEEIGIPNHSVKVNFVFRFVYLFAHRVIAISYAVRDYLAKHEVSPNKISVVYNPIEVKHKIKKPNGIGDKVVLCFLGRLEPIKNGEALIHLMAQLKTIELKIKIELWMIGDGTQLSKLKLMCCDLGVDENVKFLGFQPDPSTLMEQAHIFIIPSWNEGFGLACIEGIQSGLVVIVSQNGGMKEFIRNGVNGFVINPAGANDILNKTLIAINQSDAEREQFSTLAIEQISDMFSPVKYLNSLKSIYRISSN